MKVYDEKETHQQWKKEINCDFQLPNHLFEELAMDVYDEVDRRENNQSKSNRISL